jgi:capsular exopolysaccharide synthesis family protein
MIANRSVSDNPDWIEQDRELAALRREREGLSARVATLQGVMAEQSGIISRLPQAATQSETLAREHANNGERLGDVTKKLNRSREELQQTDAKGSLQVRYWAGQSLGSTLYPEIPARPGATKKMMAMLAAAFMLSLLGSAGLLLGLDFLDTTLKTPMDVERMLNAPVTGIVPRLSGSTRQLMPRITHDLPASPHAESYRFLGADILLSAEDEATKTIMVATAKPNQGGTATICNLAITLAQAGRTVALVDADLRRPSLHHIFNLANETGLSTVLANGRMPSDELQRTEIENLMVMTGGPIPENAWKLLRSVRMREVINDLARDFDFVLFDTPSAVVFADAATIATMVDGVLLVVRAQESPAGSELQVKNLLNKTKARIVGVVLNDMPVQNVDSARFYSHYYAPDSPAAKAVAPSGAVAALPQQASRDDEI